MSFSDDSAFWGLFYAQVIYSKVEEAGVGKAENEALLASARAHDWIAGVVGWVLLDLPNEAERMLDALADERAFVGVRHLVNVEPDPDWVVRSAVLDGLKVLAARGLTFDYVAILPRHLEHVAVLAQGIP